MWFSNKDKDILRYRDILDKLDKRVSSVESDIINVLAQQKMLRDKVLRRFRGNIDQEEQENEGIKYYNPFKP